MERILIGGLYNNGEVQNALFEFTDANIVNCACEMTSAAICNEIVIDQLYFTISNYAFYLHVGFIPLLSTGFMTSDGKRLKTLAGGDIPSIKNTPYGTPVYWYNDENLVGKFYFLRTDRISKYDYKVTAVSAIGLLDGETHYGGIYTGQTFSQVVADIIGGSVVYSIDAAVANIKVIGWLPIGTKRSNLHQLLFATGVNITKDANGDIKFSFLSDSPHVSVPDDRIFYGGEVSYNEAANGVDVTEHTFENLPSDKESTLFDNTDGSGTADATVITFSNPQHDLTVSGALTIVESGVNYAKVSGVGKLLGKEYTHTKHVISKRIAGGANRTISAQDATLVSVLNSQNVADRLLAFYSSARTIKSDIVVHGEKPSNFISFNNPYGESETALLASMSINASSFLRANCELIADYAPTGEGNNFNNAVVLTGGGTWTKPAGVTRLRAVLIGGGHGGQSGETGENGENGGYSISGSAAAGAGGKAGLGGVGGKIFLIDTQNIPDSVSYSCGAGGVGGQTASGEITDGTAGTDTVFGNYSSADGSSSESGIPNILSGQIYGLTGENGVDGGDGSQKGGEAGNSVIYHGTEYVSGSDGGDYNNGGIFASGGGGGGACAGFNGSNGADGSERYVSGHHPVGGNGGDGATPSARSNATQYGQGGDGGHGGGGGGGGGNVYGTPDRFYTGAGGSGGAGGRGGKGGDGCIILYY